MWPARLRRDRDRHRQPLILNWAGHPTSTTPTNNNNHVELAHAQLVGEVAKKNRARFARVKYLQQLRISTPLSQILDTPLTDENDQEIPHSYDSVAHTMAENDPRPPALPLFSLDSASPLSALDSAQPGSSSTSTSNFEFHDDEIDALFGACASSFDEPAVESSTKRLGKRKFGPSKSDNDVATARITAIPKKTLSDTKYCIGVWNEWCVHRAIKYGDIILPIGELTMEDLSRHLSRFILEVRKKDGREFPPESLHHVVCGIQRHLRFNGKPSVDFFKDSSFAELRMTLDAEMKRLQRSGLGSKKKKAEPITPEEEEIMWKKGILGESTPQALVDTMLYMNGLYFALKSGEEHRQLRFHQCQIQVIERPGERAYLQYTEEISKNRPGGLKNRKLKPKTVVHYANERNPNRCFVRLFKLYKSKCPTENLKKMHFIYSLSVIRAMTMFGIRLDQLVTTHLIKQ